VSFLMVLTESAASAAGAAAAAIAAAQEVGGQQRVPGTPPPLPPPQQQQQRQREGLDLRLPPPGMVAFYQSYERYVETAALPSWWLKVRGPGASYILLLLRTVHGMAKGPSHYGLSP
jgi:hypothetical protein